MNHVWRLLLAAVTTLSASIETSTAQWLWQNPLPQGNSLHHVFAFENGTSIAVGDVGTVLKIDASGLISEVRHNVCGCRSPFNCVFFRSPQIGWIGGSGVLLKSNDGGSTWHEAVAIDSGSYCVPINDIRFIDDSVGWFRTGVAGWVSPSGRLYTTGDGGTSWRCVDPSTYWIDIQLLNADTGYGIAYGSRLLFKTRDGGITWDSVAEISGRGQAVFFLDDSTGWIGASSGIFRTVDGVIWNQTLQGVDSKNIWFRDAQHGWAIVDDDSIIHTADGGLSWSGQPCANSAPVELNAFAFNSQDYGVCVGMYGHVRTKGEQLSQWQGRGTSSLYGKIVDIHVLNDMEVWLCGVEYAGFSDPNMYGYEYFRNALLHTVDGGEHWTKTTFPDTTIYGFTDIFFWNSRNGWVTGNLDFHGPNVILHTTDGGNTWQEQQSGLSWVGLGKIFFVDSLHGWIAGSEWSTQGILFITHDGGDTWQNMKYKVPYNFAPMDIFFLDRNTGWMSGFEGANSVGEVHATTDGGQTWRMIRTGPSSYSGYCSVLFFDSLTGYITFRENYDDPSSGFESTSDGGSTWHTSVIADRSWIESVCFVDKDKGWAAGKSQDDLPEVYHTRNGGLTWSRHPVEQTVCCNRIAFADSNTGWLVGESAILKTTRGSVSSVEEGRAKDLPTNPWLFQNYPNPFNPKTVVSSQLSVASWVRLVVYDMLGREVAVLMDGYKAPGTYRVEIDGAKLSSGVYICRMTAGSFAESITMLLLR